MAAGADVFEEVKLIYFDGPEEIRTPFSVSGFGGDIWDTGYFVIPDDLDNPAYDYPETIVGPAAGVDCSYAISITGSMEFTSNLGGCDWDLEVSVTGDVEKYVKSYDAMTWTAGNFDVSPNTVRVPFEDADGTQEQRS